MKILDETGLRMIVLDKVGVTLRKGV